MIEIFVAGCVMTIALFLAVFERKNVVKGDESVSTGPGYWAVPDSTDLKDGDTSSGSSDESDQESDPEKQQLVAKQDCASVLQLRLHRFGEYRSRKEVNDLLILLVYYYSVIIKILGVLLVNQSSGQSGITRNVSTITLYKEDEEFPLDDELPISSKKKKSKAEKEAQEVVMPICLRKNDEAMYHEASIDNLDVLIAQRQKIETYISRLSESDVDIVKDVRIPAELEERPRITNDESDVRFKVSIERNKSEDRYEPIYKKDDIMPELETLQAKLGEAKDEVNNELASLKTKLGYDLSPKLKPESSIDESDSSMPTLKSISLDDSDLDISSSQLTETEYAATEVEVCPGKDSTMSIVKLIEKDEKDNDQITIAQEPVYGNSYHTGAIPKYSHPDTSKVVTNNQAANFTTPIIHVEDFKEPEKDISNPDSLICESKPVNTHETSKAEIVKIKPIEKDILDGSEDEDIDIDDSEEDSDVSIPNMKGSYTLPQEDFEMDDIYEDRDPMAFLMEENESGDDLSENFVDQFFSDESVPCAPVPDTTYQIDPILEEESEDDSSIQDKDDEHSKQLTVPSVNEDKFAMTFSRSFNDDDEENIEQSTFQTYDEIAASESLEENKHIDDMESDKNIHSYSNGNMHEDVLHKINGLTEKLDEIKNQELNVECIIIEDITEDVITVEIENQLNIHRDEPCSSKLEQCKAFNGDEKLEAEVDTEVLKNVKINESNDASNLPINKKEISIKEESVLHKIDGNESLNPIQNLNDKSQDNQNDNSNSILNKPLTFINGENETDSKKNIKYGTQVTQSNEEFSFESMTPDMHFENSDVLKDIDILSVRISAESPTEASVIENDTRTSSVIDVGLVSDKSEPIFSEKDSALPVTKGERVLLDLSEDHDCSAIDTCEAFWADIAPPEDFVYEGETVYERTVKLENFKNLENLQAAVVSADECNHKIVLDVHEFRHGDLRVSAIGETEILVEAVSEVPEQDAKEIRKFRQKFLLPVTASATDSIAALSSDGVLAIITPKKDGSTPSIKRKLPEDVETPEKSSKYTTKHDPRSNETEKSTIIDREMVECFLPILQRGNFFTDSIFQETRQDFNTAISEVLDKWGDRSVHDPQRGTQREEPKEDNQVMVITDDDNNTRKILVDIADFTHDGEVKINVMDEELVVEGRTKKAEGGATSVKTFIRRFTLAPDIDPSAVTSVVTPDGILEITTPKKAVIPKLKEFSIQVIIELIVEESRTSPRKDSKTRRKLKDKSPAKDNNSSHSRKKKKVHPEDAKKQDNKQQDAKKHQEQTQSLMQEAWAPEASAGLSTDGLENNKNKISSAEKQADVADSLLNQENSTLQDESKSQLSSDEAKSLEAQAVVSQKELKDSSIEGLREKLTETVELPSKVSEASVDKATKESEDGKPSTTSQPDVHKTDEKSNEATLQELAKKQIAQDETSKLLPSESEKDNATTTSKSFTEKQELATPDKSVTGEQKSTTDQPELATADNKSQSKDNLIKPTPVDISQQKSEELSETVSQQSQSGESIKTDKSSIQEVGEEVKSTVKKSVKEKSKKVESDESVKPKKSTVKKKVLEKTDTESRESSRIPKVEIQGSTSSKRKEEEKSISTKNAKEMFQSKATAASGSTTDVSSAGSGSGISDSRLKSTSYSTLPGSSSPSSGYLATGTKSISSGSFTPNVTEEYLKKKPLPRNRPFFNLRDFL